MERRAPNPKTVEKPFGSMCCLFKAFPGVTAQMAADIAPQRLAAIQHNSGYKVRP